MIGILWYIDEQFLHFHAFEKLPNAESRFSRTVGKILGQEVEAHVEVNHQNL